jgi:hypothetical protein
MKWQKKAKHYLTLTTARINASLFNVIKVLIVRDNEVDLVAGLWATRSRV